MAPSTGRSSPRQRWLHSTRTTTPTSRAVSGNGPVFGYVHDVGDRPGRDLHVRRQLRRQRTEHQPRGDSHLRRARCKRDCHRHRDSQQCDAAALAPERPNCPHHQRRDAQRHADRDPLLGHLLRDGRQLHGRHGHRGPEPVSTPSTRHRVASPTRVAPSTRRTTRRSSSGPTRTAPPVGPTAPTSGSSTTSTPTSTDPADRCEIDDDHHHRLTAAGSRIEEAPAPAGASTLVLGAAGRYPSTWKLVEAYFDQPRFE